MRQKDEVDCWCISVGQFQYQGSQREQAIHRKMATMHDSNKRIYRAEVGGYALFQSLTILFPVVVSLL